MFCCEQRIGVVNSVVETLITDESKLIRKFAYVCFRMLQLIAKSLHKLTYSDAIVVFRKELVRAARVMVSPICEHDVDALETWRTQKLVHPITLLG